MMFDPYRQCRLCFTTPGVRDVTSATHFVRAIKELYNIDIKSTDTYSKSLCQKCLKNVDEFYMHLEVVKSGQRMFQQRIQMLEQMSHMKVEPNADDHESPPVVSNTLESKTETNMDDDDIESDQMTEPPDSPRCSPSSTFGASPTPQQTRAKTHIPALVRSTRSKTPIPTAIETSIVSSSASKRNGHVNGRGVKQSVDKQKAREKRSAEIAAKNGPKQSDQNVIGEAPPGKTATTNNKKNHEISEKDSQNVQKLKRHRELEALKTDQVVAGRISNRRSTMASNRVEVPVTPVKTARKRHLSVHETCDDNRMQTDAANENTPITLKRMRIEHGIDTTSNKNVKKSILLVLSNGASQQTPNKITPAKSILQQNQTKAYASPTTGGSTAKHSLLSSTASSPSTATAATNKATPQAQRVSSRPITSTTPRITQYFARNPMHRCGHCALVLSSAKELKFHNQSHSRKQCVKCRKRIDNTKPSSIHNHVITCLFLNNELPKNAVKHFLKVKVDLNRLTPRKIAEIKRNLSHSSKNLTLKTESTDTEANNRSETQNNVDLLSPSVDNAQKTNDKSTDDRQGAKKKTRKSSNKSSTTKNAQYEENDDYSITESESASVNWSDETHKDKLYTSRDFESDTSIYNDVKKAEELNQSFEPNEVNFVQRIKKARELSRNPHPVVVNQPRPAANAIVNTALAGILRIGPNAVPSPSIVQQATNISKPSNSPKIVSAQQPTDPATQTIALEIRSVHSLPISCPHYTSTPNVSDQRLKIISPAVTTTAATNRVPTPNTNPNPIPIPNSSSGISTSTFSAVNVPSRVYVPNPLKSPIQKPNDTSMVPTSVAAHNPRMPYAPHTPNVHNTPNVAHVPCPTNEINSPRLPGLLGLPIPRNRAKSMYYSATEYPPMNMRRPSDDLSTQNPANRQSKDDYSQHLYNQAMCRQSIAQLPPPYMTQVHTPELAKCNTQMPPAAVPSPNLSTLKVLTPDDLNSRAMNAGQPIQSNTCSNRIDDPSLMENNTNLNNNNQAVAKRPRTKTTPMRRQSQSQSHQLIDDSTNMTISVSLSRLGTNYAELTLTAESIGKISYDTLSEKRKQEVRSSLLKDSVWLQMLGHLKKIRPTSETVHLFEQILPKPQYDRFINELREVYPNEI